MPAKKKRGGRVTPKGTQNPAPSKKGRRPDPPDRAQSLPGHVPQQMRKEHGRGARPITHNRGNR